MDLLAVGHPGGVGPAGGWDAWPLLGLVIGVALTWKAGGARRPSVLALAAIAGALVLPVIAQGWGVPAAAGVCLALWVLLAAARRTPRRPGNV